MANTYTLISSTTVSGTTTTGITFSSIPSTYTDLVLKISAKSDNTASDSDLIQIQFSSNTSTVYSRTGLNGNGAGASSFTLANASSIYANSSSNSSGPNITANTFSSAEIYIPNFQASVSKPVLGFGAQESNWANPNMTLVAGLTRDTSPISSIYLFLNNGPNFVAGSTFYLYGIKNA